MSALALWLNRVIYLMGIVATAGFGYQHEWGAACWSAVATIQTLTLINERRRADRWEAFVTNRASA